MKRIAEKKTLHKAQQRQAQEAQKKEREAKWRAWQVQQQHLEREKVIQRVALEREREQQRSQAQFWQHLDGAIFEREVAKLFERAGYRVELTPASGDQDIDILLYRGSQKIVVQCKAPQKPIGPSVIRDLYGAMMHTKADAAKLVSLGGFTQGVYTFATGKPVELLDLAAILHLQRQMGRETSHL